MRRKILLVALVLLGSLTVFVPSARALSIGVNFFYDDLAPHGQWFQMENYGWVWTPRHVAATGARTRWATGHTATTTAGPGSPTRTSAGRRTTTAAGSTTGPTGGSGFPATSGLRRGSRGATVEATRAGRPCPPTTTGSAVALRRRRILPGGPGYLAPTQYVFVREPYLADTGVYRHIVPWDRDDQIVRVTRDVTRYETVGDRIVNRAVPVREVERAARRAVPRYRVETAPTAPRRARGAGEHGEDLPPDAAADRERAGAAHGPRADAVPRVKPQPAAPPANPREVRARDSPAPNAPAPNTGVTRGAEPQNQRAERQRQQELTRQKQARATEATAQEARGSSSRRGSRSSPAAEAERQREQQDQDAPETARSRPGSSRPRGSGQRSSRDSRPGRSGERQQEEAATSSRSPVSAGGPPAAGGAARQQQAARQQRPEPRDRRRRRAAGPAQSGAQQAAGAAEARSAPSSQRKQPKQPDQPNRKSRQEPDGRRQQRNPRARSAARRTASRARKQFPAPERIVRAARAPARSGARLFVPSGLPERVAGLLDGGVGDRRRRATVLTTSRFVKRLRAAR